MSDNFKHTAGLQNVGSYQVSGKPFVTASTVTDGTEEQIEFPEVSNNITVKLDSAAGGVGTTYNSVEIKGTQLYYRNTTEVLASDGDNRTITTWLSASSDHTAPNGGILIGGNTINNQFMIKEKNAGFQAQLRDIVGVKTIGILSLPSGWFHLALVASSSNTFKVYINSNEYGSVNIDQTKGQYLGGGLVLGPPAGGDTDLKFRDSILWDDALTSSEIIALYQASASYDDPAFSVANKLVWIKPTASVVSSPVNSLYNFGDRSTYGDMSLNLYDSGETAEISSDAPFADVPGSGGELRVHFRSTGSLPNVATNKHYWTLDSQNESITMNVKSKELYLSADGGDCDYSVEAELTNIPSSRMFQHTGSGVDE